MRYFGNRRPRGFHHTFIYIDERKELLRRLADRHKAGGDESLETAAGVAWRDSEGGMSECDSEGGMSECAGKGGMGRARRGTGGTMMDLIVPLLLLAALLVACLLVVLMI